MLKWIAYFKAVLLRPHIFILPAVTKKLPHSPTNIWYQDKRSLTLPPAGYVQASKSEYINCKLKVFPRPVQPHYAIQMFVLILDESSFIHSFQMPHNHQQHRQRRVAFHLPCIRPPTQNSVPPSPLLFAFRLHVIDSHEICRQTIRTVPLSPPLRCRKEPGAHNMWEDTRKWSTEPNKTWAHCLWFCKLHADNFSGHFMHSRTTQVFCAGGRV